MIKFNNVEFDISKQFRERTEKIGARVKEDLTKIVANDAKQVFDEAVEKFYADYKPKIYERPSDEGHGLYDLYGVEIEGDKFNISVDSDNLTYDPNRVDAVDDQSLFKEYLFEETWNQGYHGGADKISEKKAEKLGAHPHPGTPWYRTPHPSYWSWKENGAAKRTKSPDKMIKEMLKNYPREKYQEIAEQLWDKYARIVGGWS